MVLAGLVRLEGVEYYFAWKTLKKSNTYVLFSKVHAQDLATYEIMNKHEFPIIQSATQLPNFATKDYVMEIVEELKVSGRMKRYSRFNTSLLNKILKELSFARTYSFSQENTYTNESTFVNGKILKDFKAKDKNLSYLYEKSGDEFQRIEIEHNDFNLMLTTKLANFSLKEFNMQELENYQKKEISTLTLDAVSFDKLCNLLDMSWFWDSETGKTKKHYEVIQTITDFEYKIMYQLYRELEHCKKNGTKLNISVDTETTGLNIYNLSENNEDRDHCVAIPISWKPDTAYVIFTDMEYFSNVPNQYAIDRLAQLFENFKGERTITVYEPPKEYWNDNDVVTLIQENKNEEEKKKEESQNNVIKEVQENSAEITEKSKSSLGKMNLFGKINSNEDELFSDDTLFAVDKNDVVKQVFNAGEQDNALAKNSKQIKFTFVRNLINLIGHNIMFDRRVFYMFGKSFYFDDDTLQMGFDLNPKTVRGSVALKGLTHRLLGHETPELSDILGKGNEDKYRYLYDILVAMVYGCADADYTLTIFHILRKLMSKRMYKEYKRQDVQMLNILAISEYYGMKTIEKDVEALAKESGFSTVSQYVKENWNSDDFASINYWLKYTLMDLDNAYNYNTTGLIYDKSNGWEVVIADSTLAKIKEHPENFVYLTLSYQEN